MKKILILHRSDLFGLADDLPLEKLVIEHFNIPLQEVADASFIAFEDKDLLKILKNDRGGCGTTTVNDFLMRAPELIDLINPRPKFSIGFDPVAIGCDVSAFTIRENGVTTYIGRNNDKESFDKEVALMKNYYGDVIIDDNSLLIDKVIKRIANMSAEAKRVGATGFPESLLEAVLYFNPKFDNVFKIMFRHSQIYFTSTLRISYPELYAEIKKECGLWCEDTPLFNDLLTYGCKHEDCMINVILKAIYRFRNFGRDRSRDITAVIEEAKPK